MLNEENELMQVSLDQIMRYTQGKRNFIHTKQGHQKYSYQTSSIKYSILENMAW